MLLSHFSCGSIYRNDREAHLEHPTIHDVMNSMRKIQIVGFHSLLRKPTLRLHYFSARAIEGKNRHTLIFIQAQDSNLADRSTSSWTFWPWPGGRKSVYTCSYHVEILLQAVSRNFGEFDWGTGRQVLGSANMSGGCHMYFNHKNVNSGHQTL